MEVTSSYETWKNKGRITISNNNKTPTQMLQHKGMRKKLAQPTKYGVVSNDWRLGDRRVTLHEDTIVRFLWQDKVSAL